MDTKPFRVIVTGSRDWPYPFIVEAALKSVAFFVGGSKNMIVVHGANPGGADSFAGRWAMKGDARIEAHAADWKKSSKAAGPLRNAEMVELGADLCLAFLGPCTRPRCPRGGAHPSHGAHDCANRAEANGIRTIRHEIWKGSSHG